MKINSLIILVVFVFISQISLAARLTVYNKTPYTQDVTIYADGQPIAGNRIESNKEKTFNSGLSRFSAIVWRLFNNNRQRTTDPEYFEGYLANIPSSLTMLLGEVRLWPSGGIGINFDKDGVSKAATRAFYGEKIQIK